MYIALMGCAQQGAGGAPLAATIDHTAPFTDVIDVVGSATGSVVTFTNQGGFDISVVASGGTGVYTYSWNAVKVGESSDTGNRFSINSAGTTNAARYNTLTVDGARPATEFDPPFDVAFDVTCTVDDGVSQVITGTLFICNGVTIP